MKDKFRIFQENQSLINLSFERVAESVWATTEKLSDLSYRQNIRPLPYSKMSCLNFESCIFVKKVHALSIEDLDNLNFDLLKQDSEEYILFIYKPSEINLFTNLKQIYDYYNMDMPFKKESIYIEKYFKKLSSFGPFAPEILFSSGIVLKIKHKKYENEIFSLYLRAKNKLNLDSDLNEDAALKEYKRNHTLILA